MRDDYERGWRAGYAEGYYYGQQAALMSVEAQVTMRRRESLDRFISEREEQDG